MEKTKIRNIGIERGLKEIELRIFVEFISRRFPEENSPAYICEWARRFISSEPECLMDCESKEIYIKVLRLAVVGVL